MDGRSRLYDMDGTTLLAIDGEPVSEDALARMIALGDPTPTPEPVPEPLPHRRGRSEKKEGGEG